MNKEILKEKSFLKKFNTPAKVQDFLNTIPFNFEKNGKDTIKSPFRVIKENNAHCLEGAILGAYMLKEQGYKPLVLHLQAQKEDFDHVIAPFKKDGFWGALSKTNHAVLRYREPVYKNIRELVLSYFHEYFFDDGKKTLRRYSDPFNLNTLKRDWVHAKKDLWEIDKALDKTKHHDIAPKKVFKNLRKADKIEIKAGKIVEWKN